MTSEALGERGAERRLKRAQTREPGPPSAAAEIFTRYSSPLYLAAKRWARQIKFYSGMPIREW